MSTHSQTTFIQAVTTRTMAVKEAAMDIPPTQRRPCRRNFMRRSLKVVTRQSRCLIQRRLVQ